MKRLVVNADDLGAEEGRNRGILETIEKGAVTSASLLPNGPALKDALAGIRGLGQVRVSWGVHLNLSEGEPLSSRLRLLTGPDGRFLGKAAAQRLLMRVGDAELEGEVAKEIDEQIRRLREAGVPLSHLNGHQHVHVFPAVVRKAVEAAAGNGIPWFRIPEQPPPEGANGPARADLEAEIRLFSGLASEARGLPGVRSLRTPDRFFGLPWKGRLTRDAVEAMARCVPEGLSELMVHPGRMTGRRPGSPFRAFSTPERQQELETLLAPFFGEILAREGIELTPFPGG